jgi:Tol biopolymer transport system component
MKYWGVGLVIAALCGTNCASAFELTQLTTSNDREAWSPSITADGNTVVYVSGPPIDPVTGQLDHSNQVYAVDVHTGAVRQLTTFVEAPNVLARVARGGGVVLIRSDADPLGLNSDGSSELFTVRTDGGSFSQLTRSENYVNAPIHSFIQADGKRVAFVSKQDLLLQGGTANSDKVYLVNSDGTNLLRLAKDPLNYNLYHLGVAQDGSAAIYQYASTTASPCCDLRKIDLISGEDTLVTKASYVGDSSVANGGRTIVIADKDKTTNSSIIIFLVQIDSVGVVHRTQLTPSDGYGSYGNFISRDSWNPTITPDGSRIVFMSNIDLVGKNADHRLQIFYADVATKKIHQVTSFADHDIFAGYQISDDGGVLIVLRSASTNAPRTIYAYSLATGARIKLGTASAGPFGNSRPVAISADGNTVVINSEMDPLGTNREKRVQLFLVRGLRDTEGFQASSQASDGGGSGSLGLFDLVVILFAVMIGKSRRLPRADAAFVQTRSLG